MDRPTERYHNDPIFRRVVDAMEHMLANAELASSELRQAAVLAAIHYEMRRIQSPYFVLTGADHSKLLHDIDAVSKQFDDLAEKGKA